MDGNFVCTCNTGEFGHRYLSHHLLLNYIELKDVFEDLVIVLESHVIGWLL